MAENKIDMAHDNSGLASSGDHNNLTQQNHSGSGDSVGNNKIVIDKLIVQNLPQTPQEPQKDIPYSLAIPPNFTQPHYITRTIDNTINEIIQTQLHQMVVINAEGGYGKSTLIENLFQRYTDTPMIVINKQSQADTNLVDLLMDAEFSTMQNTPNLNSLKKQYIDSQVHEIELLDALQKDFTNYGVFIVDTFEKIKGVDISSYVNFGTHQIERRKEVRHSRLKDYIESLFSTLLGNASFIVAGRNDLREINFEKIDDGFLQELTIEGFSDENIVEYFKRSNIEIPNKEMIAEINTLTRSNPLLITLLPKIIKEYDSGWSELDIEEMRRRVERDEQYGLLFYLTDRVLSHIDSSIELYPLIITRVLNRNIEKLLYWETKVLDRLVESGLAYRGKGKENELYYLHDSVAAAIVADTKREYQQNYSSYHDNPKIRQLHQAFIEYYQDYQNVYNINLALEIGYHTVLLKQNFEGTFNVEREVFIKLLLGTMSLVNNEKVHICKNFENLSKFYIEELNRILTEEESQWLKLFSPALYQELKRLSQMGKLPIANIGENIFGLKQKSQFKLHWDNDIQFLLMLNSKECLQKDAYLKILIGNAYLKNNEYDKALEAYTKATEINPKNDSAYNFLGSIYSIKKEYNKAIEAYQKAIVINPKNDSAYYSIGDFYSKKGEYDKAIEAYQKAIEINPKKGMAYCGLGSVYFKKGEYDKTIEAYTKAFIVNPEEGSAHILGRLYSDKKEYDKAIEAYQKAIVINPKNSGVYYDMGVVYEKKKKYDKAVKAYTKVVEINPQNDSAYHSIGVVYEKKKEYNQAIEAYQKAIAINPQKDEVYYNMGNVYYHLGKLDEVIESYIQALNINPSNSSAYANLFELQLIQNQTFNKELEERYISLFNGNKETFVKYEMLKILQAIHTDQNYSLSIEEWQEKYQGIGLGGWGWDELEGWIETMEESQTKSRLIEALAVFKAHQKANNSSGLT